MNSSTTHKKSKTIVVIGTTVILSLLAILFMVWANNVNENKKILAGMAENQTQTQLITIMQSSIVKRSLVLYRMTMIKDALDREDESEALPELASDFLVAREQFLNNKVEKEALQLWNDLKPFLDQGGSINKRARDLFNDEKMQDATNLLFEELAPIQNKLLTGLSLIVDSYSKKADDNIVLVSNRNKKTYWILGLVGSSTIILALLLFVIARRQLQTEAQLLEQGNRIRALYNVSTQSGTDIDTQISLMLKLSCELLNMEIAKVCQVDVDKNTNTFLYTYAPSVSDAIPGTVVNFDTSLNMIPFSQNKTIHIEHVSKSTLINSNNLNSKNIESYIASVLFVHGMKFGAINFASHTPRSSLFNETDIDLANLISSWVSLALERKQDQSELLKAKEDAESANTAKSRFLANMSHELRTPLNAIIGYSEILCEDAQDNHHEFYMHDLENIHESGGHLLHLINDILDLSKVEAGKMTVHIEKISVLGLIHEVAEIIKPLAMVNDNQITIECDDDIGDIHADITKLRQILMNLLSNSCKFTKNGSISLSVTSNITHSEPDFTFTISDTGIGMNSEQMNKLFKPFTQADDSTIREYGGTGLGLTISKYFINMMGGNITLESYPNQGTTFTVHIPATVKSSIIYSAA